LTGAAGIGASKTAQKRATSVEKTGAFRRSLWTENDIDAAGHSWHDGTRRYGDESGH
jgi:hypothetical protein